MERIAKHVGENGSSSFSTPLWDPNDINGNSTIVLHNLVVVVWERIETMA